MVKKLGLLTFCASLASVMSLTAPVKSVDGPDDDHDRFRVTSTFENNSTLPISAINTMTLATVRNITAQCPPANFPPNVHHYAITVYALDEELTLPSSPNFLPVAATLFQALIKAGEHGHISASAKIVGLYSTAPGN